MKVFLNFFKNFLPFIKGHYVSFFIAILGTIMAALCTALITYLVEPILGMLNGKEVKTLPFVDLDSIANSPKVAIFMAICIIAVYLGKSGGNYVQAYFMNLIGQDIVRQVRDKILYKLLTLELNFFNKTRGGELLSRITNDIGIIRSAVSNYITEFIREIITILGLIVVVFYQSPKLALIGLIVIPLAMVPVNKIIQKLKKYARNLQEKNADITSKLLEIFNNIEIIKISNGEELEYNHFRDENKQFLKINMKEVRARELATPLMEFLGACALALIIHTAAIEIKNGELSSEQFASFAAALFMIYTPLKRIINMINNMQSAIIASERIFAILDKQPKIKYGTKRISTPIHSIELKNVCFSYEDEDMLEQKEHIAALDNINLTFRRNEVTALVGKSGAGKSTMVNLLIRLYDCNSGEILINDINIKEYLQNSLYENISIVTQRIFIFNDTIAKNVAYGLEINEDKVVNVLKSAQMWDYVSKLPNGIHTILDEFGTNLSGGQKQRIAIARAIYRDPEVLILDEATSALDVDTELQIKNSINLIRKDKIIIIIAHRPSTIELADKIVRMSEGKITKIHTH